MPSFQDSAVIFIIALLLFGPKKLPELARQLGKLMGEFRRASSDFRMQMEDELRMAEQADRQKKIAEIEAAAPAAPALESSTAELAGSQTYEPVDYVQTETEGAAEYHVEDPKPEALPIASEGDLRMMPPETGLPVGRSAEIHGESALSPLLDAIPEATPAEVDRHTIHAPESAVDQHG